MLCAATFRDLAGEVWTLDIGAHGPIVLVASLWLLARALPDMAKNSGRKPGFSALVLAAIFPLAAYALGRAFDYISIQTLGWYLLLWILALHLFGASGLKGNLFPLTYPAFLLPVPGWLLDSFTMPLRGVVSELAAWLMAAFGYPILNMGVAISVGPYRLLVEDACSGMNSLVGLAAVTVLYIHLLCRASWRYALLLLALILPVAIVINFIRVVILILLTYHAGDGVAQGFLHVTAGAVLFLAGLLIMYAVERGLRSILPRDFVGAAA